MWPWLLTSWARADGLRILRGFFVCLFDLFFGRNKWQMKKLPESGSLCWVYLLGQDEAVAAECEQGCAQVGSVPFDLWWDHTSTVSPLGSVLSITMRHMLRVWSHKDTGKAWALPCPLDYNPSGLKIRDSTRDPLMCRVYNSPISFHPFILATNDAMLKLPWALPVPC